MRKFNAALATIAVTAASLVATTPAVQAAPPEDAPAPAAAPAETVGQEVTDALADNGEVKVMVMLDGHRPGSDVAQLRRRAKDVQSQVLAGLEGDAVQDVRRFETIPAFVATLTSPEALDRLARRPGVARIDVEREAVRPALDTSVPFVGGDALHDLGLTGEGATVAVIDSGIDTEHPDLAGKVVLEACFAPWEGRMCPGDFGWFEDEKVVGPGSAPDDQGHGTAVAGIVASEGIVSGVGMAPDADLIAVKVFDADCFQPCETATEGLLFAADYFAANPQLGVDVINMSLGSPIPYTGTDCDDVPDATVMMASATAANIRAAGTTIVASAGNDGQTDGIGLPACLSTVLSVGGTLADDTVVGYSNTGPGLDILAPVWSRSAAPGGGTAAVAGTSSAAPMVAGCAALLSQMDAAPGPDEITAAINSTGVPVQRGSATYPRLDCEAAAQAIDADLGGDAAPIVEAQLMGDAGTEGWYRSDVTVTWDISSTTPVTTTTGCDEVVLTAETAGEDLTCSATNANGTTTVDTTVRIDRTPPTLAPTVTPNPVAQGASASVDVGATDALSGIRNEECFPVDTSTVGTFEVVCGAMDLAGNLVNATATYEVVAGNGGGTECVTAANTAHVSAGRATAVWGYAFARGTADSLGRNRSTVVTSLRQIGTDAWELVSSC